MPYKFNEGDQVTHLGSDDRGTIVELAGELHIDEHNDADSDCFYTVSWDNGMLTTEAEHALTSWRK